jgi:uncharacterized protein (DUF58 family)
MSTDPRTDWSALAGRLTPHDTSEPPARKPASPPPPVSTTGQGPGDLTLASIVLFTLGAYGVAAGAATGQEAVVAVGVFAFTLFVVGIVWPVAVLSRIEVDVVAPPDAVVGETLQLHVTVRGRASRVDIRVLDPGGAWWCTGSPAKGTLPHVAARRGVFSVVRIQIRTSAPLGVFVRTRTIRAQLPVPATVAPHPLMEGAILRAVPEELLATAAPMFTVGGGDTVRAVRPYVPGDPARLVHWPTSARRGELVVREHEPPPALGVALVVDLRGLDPEDAASRAMGIGQSTLAAGGVVWCGTFEADGAVGELVPDTRALGRRLARAIEGEPATPPDHWPTEWVRA